MRLASISFATACAALMCGLATAPADATTIEVAVTDIRSDKGAIMASLLKANMAKGIAEQVKGVREPARPGELKLTFEGLEPGEYAIMLYHDENGNGEMDKNLFGLPQEGYGFSNAARSSFGPPKFRDMKVVVAEGGRVVTTAPINY